MLLHGKGKLELKHFLSVVLSNFGFEIWMAS